MIKSPKTMANLERAHAIHHAGYSLSTFASGDYKFGFRELPDLPLSTVSVIDCRKGYKLAFVSLSQMHGRVPEGSSITQFTYFHNRFSSWVLNSQKIIRI